MMHRTAESNKNRDHFLSEADLTGANLIDANLSGADLYNSKFIYALLIRANFAWTYLHQVDLVGANLSCANLSGAYFYLTNLTNTIWDECGITDVNGDGYDDASFAAGAASVDTNNDGLVDEFPIISIVDGSATVLMQGSLDEYTDSGATCSDQEDGEISHGVEVSGQLVNMNIPGTYTISYDCSDSDGNAAQTKDRTVFVIPPIIADENEDGFDDDAFLAGAQSGDVNLDGVLNVSDIVLTIDMIINGEQ